ncbi:MAG: PAS and helix-turn-helix domain-containing protein [Planctomycetota bacterium]
MNLSILSRTPSDMEQTLDEPRATDFVAPYLFFASRDDSSEVTYVSPSVRDVLGYDHRTIPGMSYHHFVWEGDPLNEDIPECESEDLSDGHSIRALRSVLDSRGDRRILLVHTVGVSAIEGGPVIRRHNIARDVTESVTTHIRLMDRLKALEEASRRLSDQEREIADCILKGMMNRDIAKDLRISDRTVERRRAAILKHMNAANTSELVAKMVERNMLRTWTYAASDLQWQSARNSHVALAASAG